jgi:hypothetical protein
VQGVEGSRGIQGKNHQIRISVDDFSSESLNDFAKFLIRKMNESRVNQEV